jgi:hypothetical protein
MCLQRCSISFASCFTARTGCLTSRGTIGSVSLRPLGCTPGRCTCWGPEWVKGTVPCLWRPWSLGHVQPQAGVLSALRSPAPPKRLPHDFLFRALGQGRARESIAVPLFCPLLNLIFRHPTTFPLWRLISLRPTGPPTLFDHGAVRRDAPGASVEIGIPVVSVHRTSQQG